MSALDHAERGYAGDGPTIETDVDNVDDLNDPLGNDRTPLNRPNPTGEILHDRRSGNSTLDEPVLHTLARDAKAVGLKVGQVLWPRTGSESLRDWDLWGPLVFCLALALFLSITAPDDQSTAVFSGIFVLVWLGEAVVTV